MLLYEFLKYEKAAKLHILFLISFTQSSSQFQFLVYKLIVGMQQISILHVE